MKKSLAVTMILTLLLSGAIAQVRPVPAETASVSMAVPSAATSSSMSAEHNALAAPSGLAANITAPYDWYRYQGESDISPLENEYCGEACVAMAIQFAHNNEWVPIDDIVQYIGNYGWTVTGDLLHALQKWQVAKTEIPGGDMSAVQEAIYKRGHIVIVPVVLADMPKGDDFPVPKVKSNCGKTLWQECHENRYFDNGITHWLVAKGISDDGRWVITYDPNVFGSDTDKCYWYENGEPKGRDRYYSYSAFEVAFGNANANAIEITESAGVDVALIIDSTGSMDHNDPYGMRLEAAKAFIDEARLGDKIAVVSFDTDAEALAHLRTVTPTSRIELRQAVDRVDDTGGTCLDAGLQAGYEELKTAIGDRNPKAAVFLTDGTHEDCGRPYDPQSHRQYGIQGWPVFTVGLGDYFNESLLEQIAEETGGEPTKLVDPSDLQAVYFEISQQIAGGVVVLEKSVTMSQGSSQQVVANLPIGQSSASFFTAWGGSEVSLALVSPSGREINSSTSALDVYHAKGLTYELYQIQNPEAGQWVLDLYGTSLPPGGEQVDVRVAVRGQRHVFLPLVFRDFAHDTEPANHPPNTPSNPSPADDSTYQSVDVSLSWTGGDRDGDTVTYDVYFEADDLAPDVLMSGDQPGLIYDPGTLDANTMYYWRIVAQDEHGATNAGPVWAFRTRDSGGRSVVFSCGWGICTMNMDGTGTHKLTSDSLVADDPAWSPNGEQLAFAVSFEGDWEICTMKADGTGLTRLTYSPGRDEHPCWSSDGSRIAFVSERDGNRELYVMNADGTESANLTNHSAGDEKPSWSPDGTQIVFSSKRTGNQDIYVTNVDGTGVTRLSSDPTWDGEVEWSPDGAQILFASHRSGSQELYVMEPDGSDVVRLTFNSTWDGQPNWSPDGDQIIFSTLRGGEQDIYLMNVDGTGEAKLTAGQFNARWPDWRQ